MAGASLLTLIDDIATLLDDVATMTKVAATKTAGVLGDDLALNAQQLTGIRAERELPVVYAVAIGSLRNKAILVPAALLISAVVPWLITPLLMLGGAFLCFEGAEKLLHLIQHKLHAQAENKAGNEVGNETPQTHTDSEALKALADPDFDLVEYEKDKIKGAIRTDFILSAEIIVITLGTVTDATLMEQLVVLTGISVLMTLFVYGLVGGIVKLDDLGLLLKDKTSKALQKIGAALLAAAPWLMKTLSIVGTAAMFMVGGGILVHGLPLLHHAIEHSADAATHVSQLPAVSSVLGGTVSVLLNALTGVVAGGLLAIAMMAFKKLKTGT
ncbi:DUF808 domain-containing protein [Oceanobacter kriegii]|uniref:DUF808 domain-containing protein n=1 Tax=Oceanobacter kriegii TaxID=64972 RepID=UPI0003F8D0B3|nr:DUF808 domain-containing protein [Oceanobacter kriegii]